MARAVARAAGEVECFVQRVSAFSGRLLPRRPSKADPPHSTLVVSGMTALGRRSRESRRSFRWRSRASNARRWWKAARPLSGGRRGSRPVVKKAGRARDRLPRVDSRRSAYPRDAPVAGLHHGSIFDEGAKKDHRSSRAGLYCFGVPISSSTVGRAANGRLPKSSSNTSLIVSTRRNMDAGTFE